MAPIVLGEGDGRPETDANLIALVIALFGVVTTAAVVGLCGCCGGKSDTAKKKEEAEKQAKQPDVPAAAPETAPKSARKESVRKEPAPVEAPKSVKEKTSEKGKLEVKSIGVEAKPHYVELEPPPVSPFKNGHAPPKAPSLRGKQPEIPQKSARAPSMKAKESEPVPMISVVKKPAGGGGSRPRAPSPGQLPDMQFAREDDPRYRSLAQLDDVFDASQMKQSMRAKSFMDKSMSVVKLSDTHSSVSPRSGK